MTWLTDHFGEWTALLIAIGAGLRYVHTTYKAWRERRANAPTPAAAERAETDANVLTMARVRDELEADNERLRTTLAQREAQHATDRAEWRDERRDLKQEIERLEVVVRAQAADAARQYAALLEQFTDLKTRHGLDPV